MASTDKGDLQGYENEAYAGFAERVGEVVDIFNSQSNGAITLEMDEVWGDRPDVAFFDYSKSSAARAIVDATAKTYNKNTTDRARGFIKKYANNRADNISDMKNQRIDMATRARLNGIALADDMMTDAINQSLNAFYGAISGISGLVNSDPASGTAVTNTLTVQRLFTTKQKMGDMHTKIAAWVMNSAGYFNLMKQMGATPGSATELAQGVMIDAQWNSVAGAPIVVTDNSVLEVAATSVAGAQNRVFGIVAGGVQSKVMEGSPLTTFTDRTVTPNVDVTDIEYDIQTRVAGVDFSYGTAGDPALSVVASSTNWTKVATSVKNCAGVIGVFN